MTPDQKELQHCKKILNDVNRFVRKHLGDRDPNQHLANMATIMCMVTSGIMSPEERERIHKQMESDCETCCGLGSYCISDDEVIECETCCGSGRKT